MSGDTRVVPSREEVRQDQIASSRGVMQHAAGSLVVPVVDEQSGFMVQVVWPVGVIECGFEHNESQAAQR